MTESNEIQDLSKKIFFTAASKVPEIYSEDTDILNELPTDTTQQIAKALLPVGINRAQNELGEDVVIGVVEFGPNRIYVEKVIGVEPDLALVMRPHPSLVHETIESFTYPTIHLWINREGKTDEPPKYNARGIMTYESYEFSNGKKTPSKEKEPLTFIDPTSSEFQAYSHLKYIQPLKPETLIAFYKALQEGTLSMITPFDLSPGQIVKD